MAWQPACFMRGIVSVGTPAHKASVQVVPLLNEPFVEADVLRRHTSALSAHVGIRQRTSAYVIIRQHTLAYVSIRRHTSAYVSIRQHTSAYAAWLSGPVILAVVLGFRV
jgi:hypothetical protein